MSYATQVAGTLHELAGWVNPYRYREHTKEQHDFEASRRTELLRLVAVNCELGESDFVLLADTLAKADPRLATVLATVIEDFCRLGERTS